jgi:uncharacterized RDD family membrane protein YckC
MELTDADAQRSGYVSEADKRRFTTLAGVLGAVFFLAQMAVPMIAMFAFMPLFMFRMEMTEVDTEQAALFHDALYAVRTTTRMGGGSQEKRSELVRLDQDDFVQLADLAEWHPGLLVWKDRLLLLSSSRMATFDGTTVQELPTPEPLGDINRPFIHDGRPTVVEQRPDGLRLIAWSGRTWEDLGPLPRVGADRCLCSLQALSHDGRVLLFRKEGGTVYAARLGDDPLAWEVVVSEPRAWAAFLRAGEPAVVSSDETGMLRLSERAGRRWSTRPMAAQVGSFTHELAAFDGPALREVTVVAGGMPGSVRVVHWSAERPSAVQRIGGGSFFPRQMLWIMMLPQLLPMLLSLVLALVLARLMRVHRVTLHRAGEAEAAYASLTRRAIAQLIDSALMGIPMLWAVWWGFSRMDSIFEEGPRAPLWIFGAMALAFGWGLLVLAAFSVTEGLWGATPGKWATGIRVVGTDLHRCGVGRALVRNLLKLVDGFFNFLIGILMVAFTAEWQRLGDMAARTVVIRVRRHSESTAVG